MAKAGIEPATHGFRGFDIYSGGKNYKGKAAQIERHRKDLERICEYANALALWYSWQVESNDDKRGEFYKAQMEKHMDVVERLTKEIDKCK